jgi:hypothetical protein
MLINRTTILFIALIPLLCIGGLFALFFTRPPTFYSHDEVIVYMLAQQQKQVKSIDASLPWPEGVNYYAYGPAVYPYNLVVKLELTTGQQINGKVDCRQDRYQCTLTLTELMIDAVPMPDISYGREERYPRWLRELFGRIGIRL